MNEDEIQQSLLEIKKLSETAVQEFNKLCDFNFGYDAESVIWTEGFIERQRKEKKYAGAVPEGLVNVIGSYLGECIIKVTNGVWKWDEKQKDWSILFQSGCSAFPFVKVWKQFKNGTEGGESIASFFNIALNYVAKGKM
ncbi:MAG: hypothetical protein GXX85_11025, partial [Ignavibacteria bacterium]|nr:hypothetical protein [Ignavibacteria bacterium]